MQWIDGCCCSLLAAANAVCCVGCTYLAKTQAGAGDYHDFTTMRAMAMVWMCSYLLLCCCVVGGGMAKRQGVATFGQCGREGSEDISPFLQWNPYEIQIIFKIETLSLRK